MSDIRETCWDHVAGEKTATLCTGERKYLNLIGRLREKHPDLVEVVHENPDGSMVVRVPAEWMKIAPKRSVNMTPEQIEAATKRLRESRACAERNGSVKFNTEGSASCVSVKDVSGTEAVV